MSKTWCRNIAIKIRREWESMWLICKTFNSAVSTGEVKQPIIWDDDHESWVDKRLKGCTVCLQLLVYWHLPGEMEENHKKVM
jgi:hypothetical protein